MAVPVEYKNCKTWNDTVKQYKKSNPDKSFKECLVGAKSVWKEIKKTVLNVANLPNRIVKSVRGPVKSKKGKKNKTVKKSKRKSVKKGKSQK
jgi:hypothetical protein